MTNDLQSEVRGIFAEVTRYPLELLDPQANLEEELGIDSVKLGEVFSVLRERFDLSDKLDISREHLLTISGVTKALASFIGVPARNGTTASHAVKNEGLRKANGNGQSASPHVGLIIDTEAGLPEMDAIRRAEPDHRIAGKAKVVAVGGHHTAEVVTDAPIPERPVNPDGEMDLLETVRSIFAEVTRYPRELLDPEAGLEDDLGIDSVKLGEVFSVIAERYGLPAQLDIPRENLTTISGITGILRQRLDVQPKKSLPSRNGATAESGGSNGNGPSLQHVAGSVESLVLDVFAEVTRYPKDILDVTADLEEDLGIDWAKVDEVLSVLRKRLRLADDFSLPRKQSRTLRDIAASLSLHVGTEATPEAVRSRGSAAEIHGATNGRPVPLEQQVAAAPRSLESEPAALYSYEAPKAKPFSGKVLFVSGSGRGLGRDVAMYLGDLGASVVINSFHSRTKGDETAAEIRERGGDAIHLWGSMANPEHVNRVFDEIEAHYGYLDFFVGNASNGMLARLEDITVEHWEKAYRTNVIGLHQSALRAVKLMRPRGGGKIVTLSSPAAHGYVDYFGCMGTVKAAVESLTRSMAIEFAPYNIQVNCVSPGPVYGELLNKWPDSERLIRQWEDNTAYTRLCEARDVSHFIAYLLSEPVKLFTGSVLIMDGGISSQGW